MLRKLLLGSALTLASLPALARENYALVVAAADYVNLDERWWLVGPKNDADLVSTYLLSDAPVPFAPENVVVLSDTDGHDPATLANIRAAFARLEAALEPGDFVYLHFSGHGTQAPARDPDSELDGLDELFLPVDIGKWNDQVGEVENALVDDEIGALLDRLRRKGADVWVVFDSCHSGTATRGVDDGDDEVRVRQLSDEALSDLGIPQEPAVATTRSLGEDAAAQIPLDTSGPGDGVATGDDAGMGALVAFFAAQTNEVTPEKRMPKGAPDRRSQGVFTYTLFETLAEYPSATYGQIAQEVLRKYSVNNLARATPLFEGDLDRTVFGAAPGEHVAQWAGTVEDGRYTIPAGTLHGLAPGDELAVMASAALPNEDAIGYMRIVTADTFSAVLEPVERDGVALPEELPAGFLLRKLDSGVDFSLDVSLPPAGTAPADALLSALDALRTAAGPRLNFVAAGAPADLRLAVLPDSERPDALWVLPATGLVEDLDATPSVGTSGRDGTEIAAALAETLTAMAKALNLMKLGVAVGPGNLDVEVEMLTKKDDETTLRALSTTEVPVLVPDDQVHVLARNNMGIPVDVNVLYIGADYSITHWFAGRLQPGDELKRGLFRISDSALGDERMIVVVTPAKAHSAVEDLSYLAQDAIETTRGISDAGGFGALLDEAGFGETTRGAIALDDGADAGPAPMILQLEVRTRAQ